MADRGANEVARNRTQVPSGDDPPISINENTNMGSAGVRKGVAESPGIKLLSQVTCPHCWDRFLPEQVLWISEHVDLLGDPLLGPEQ